MDCEFYQMLVAAEEALIRMILGVYRMVTVQLGSGCTVSLSIRSAR